jgi:hypothetical protein
MVKLEQDEIHGATILIANNQNAVFVNMIGKVNPNTFKDGLIGSDSNGINALLSMNETNETPETLRL